MSSKLDNMLKDSPGGHSARVCIELVLAGNRYPVAQIGGGRLHFDEPVLLRARRGVVHLSIDGHTERWSATLRPNGQPSRVVDATFELNG